MKVPHVEHSLPTRIDPSFLGQRLTLRTVAIATRVVGRMLVSAPLASIDMAAQPRGAALGDVGQHTLLSRAQSPDPFESGAMSAHRGRDVPARRSQAGPSHWPTRPSEPTGPAAR